MKNSRKSQKLKPLARAVRIVPIAAAVPVALSGVALSGAASAATIKVTSLAAAPTSASCSIVDAVSSLNDGVLHANCQSVGLVAFGNNDTVDLTGFNSPVEIIFSNSLFALSLSVPATIIGDVNPNGFPYVTITQQYPTTPNSLVNASLITTDRELTIDGVRLYAGVDTVGGGVHQTNAIFGLTITNSMIVGNTASSGEGGGIFTLGTVSITDSIVSGNTALNAGGGVYAGTISILNSTLGGNLSTYGSGGGAYAKNSVDCNNSVIKNNGAYLSGGGLYAQTQVRLTTSTVSSNTAGGKGGGVRAGTVQGDKSLISNNVAYYSGGGIFASQVVSMLNSTVSGNSAVLAPGGVYAGLAASLDFTTVADNQANGVGIGLLVPNHANVLMTASLLYGNHFIGSSVTNDLDAAGLNSVVAVGGSYNLIGTYGATVSVPMDTLSCDPGLATLADNGGPTKTMALPNSSCAVDMGPISTNLASTDQRGLGYPRKSGSATDIGAYELQPFDRIFYDGFDGSGN